MEGNLGGDGERTVLNEMQYIKLAELIKTFLKSTLYFLLLTGLNLSSGINSIRITCDILENNLLKGRG